MTTDKEKTEWRILWLDSINELTTLELQEKSWRRKIIITDSPHWSYGEFICCYFDDLLYYEYSHFIKTNWITQEEYDIIKNWHNKLTKYSPKNNNEHPNAILKDKDWLEIVTLGEKTRLRLIEVVPDFEKKYLTGMKAYPEFKKDPLIEYFINNIKAKLK